MAQWNNTFDGRNQCNALQSAFRLYVNVHVSIHSETKYEWGSVMPIEVQGPVSVVLDNGPPFNCFDTLVIITLVLIKLPVIVITTSYTHWPVIYHRGWRSVKLVNLSPETAVVKIGKFKPKNICKQTKIYLCIKTNIDSIMYRDRKAIFQC